MKKCLNKYIIRSNLNLFFASKEFEDQKLTLNYGFIRPVIELYSMTSIELILGDASYEWYPEEVAKVV